MSLSGIRLLSFCNDDYEFLTSPKFKPLDLISPNYHVSQNIKRILFLKIKTFNWTYPITKLDVSHYFFGNQGQLGNIITSETNYFGQMSYMIHYISDWLPFCFSFKFINFVDKVDPCKIFLDMILVLLLQNECNFLFLWFHHSYI